MPYEHCEVFKNCENKDKCWYCTDYSQYKPRVKKIKCRKQIEKKERVKEDKRHHRWLDPVVRGKANRRKGKRAERQIENLLREMGLNVGRTPLSGALKAAGLLEVLKDHLAGDIHLTLRDGTELVIECKCSIKLDSWYKMLARGPVDIKGFCYGLPEEDFRALLFGHLPKCDKLDDYKFKRLHKFFEQDNSDIVIVIKPYNHPLFFLTQKALDLLNGVNSI